MKILFAGEFDANYNRTKIIIDGLKHFKQAEVSYYNYTVNSKLNLLKLTSACKKADVIFLPAFTHLNVPFIKTITRKPVIFDPLISRYLTKVFDYKKVKQYSPRGFKNFLKDRISMSMADLVLCDTNAHKAYFQSAIGIPEKKLHVLPVGVNTEEFYPVPLKENTQFTVGFYGSFIPLHGTKVIVEAAKLLENHPIQFELIGSGFEYEQVKHLALEIYQLTNINFTGWVNYDELLALMNSFDIALGIFGETLKTDLVIPNKIYHYAAVKKAIITKDTPAIKELFKDKQNILLCDNSPEALAEKILLLMNDMQLRNSIADAGYQMVTEQYNHKIIADTLLTYAGELLSRRKK